MGLPQCKDYKEDERAKDGIYSNMIWTPQRSREERLEKHFRTWGAMPVVKEIIDDEEVFYADGGPHYDAPKKFPNGYYVTAFAIKKGKEFHVQPLWFDYSHDLNVDDRQKARVNAARIVAIKQIKTGKEASLYD